jgi:beta-glucosidase
VSRRRPVGGGNDVKWRIRLIFASPDLVIGKKSLRNQAVDFWQKGVTLSIWQSHFIRGKIKDNAPARLSFSKSIFRFHDPSFCCLVSVIWGKGAPKITLGRTPASLLTSASMVGMISGGGSAQVDPPGGNAIMPPGKGQTRWLQHIWFPTSPLKSIRAKVPLATVQFDSGTDPAAAAALAKNADVTILFVYQWESESMDLDNLSVPEKQDDQIAKVAAANPHTVVVIESCSPVTMPWLDQVSGVLEAWFGGSRGAEAVANILFGDVNPSAKLPITFPKSEADLPHPNLVKPPKAAVDTDHQGWKRIAAGLPAFQVTYDEGVKVGYKWYDAENKPVLFPFGYGLSYTTYSYSHLKVTAGKNPRVSFTITNTGHRAGAEVAEVYASLPAAAEEPPKRLVGWSKVKLNAGESKDVTVDVDPKYLSIFNVEHNGWQLLPGDYGFMVGGSSQSLPLKESVKLP